MRKKVILFANNYWSSPYQVGSHYFANCFAKDGFDVLYVSDPINLGHRVLGRKAHGFCERMKEDGCFVSELGVRAYTPKVIISAMRRPVLDSKWVIDNWWKFSVPSVLSKISSLGFSSPDVIFFNSLQFKWALSKFPNALSIFRIADWNPAMSELPRAAIVSQNELISRSDHVFASSNGVIADFFSGFGHRVVNYLPNGFDLDALRTGTQRPPEYGSAEIKKPIVVYVGSIDERFDIDLVINSAINCDDARFFIIGKINNVSLNLNSVPSNLKFIGPKPFVDVGAYLEHADVALMPQTRLYGATDYFNPLKLYQYMRYSLPVVSTTWRELDYLAPPIKLARDEESFVRLLREAIESPFVDKEAYQLFLRGKSWNDSYQIIKNVLPGMRYE